jgi:SAM-dependent methyltransferase
VRYVISFACDDREPMQRTLNELYAYGDDLPTKVLHRCRLNLFERLMERLIAEGRIRAFGSALDIGCNAGFYAHMISGFGFRHVLGVDVVPEMIETARRHFASADPEHTVEFQVLNAEDLPRERRYDFILCTEVIEHTEDPDRVVENLKALLAPGGIAVVSLPNRVSLPYLIAWLEYRLRRRPRDRNFERHLEYPFTRSRRLFGGDDRRVIATDGTNLIGDQRSLNLFYRTPVFATLNRLQFALGRSWPCKYFTQFFYVVVQRS